MVKIGLFPLRQSDDTFYTPLFVSSQTHSVSNGADVIRRARPDECALLTRIAIRSKASWGYSEQFMADCAAELTVTRENVLAHDYFVLEDANGIVGFCGLLPRGSDEGELADVFVEPALMHRGHGRRLVEHAIAIARSRGWRSLTVHSDPNAQDFYHRCGAVQIGTVPSGSIPGRQLPLMKIIL